MELDQVIAAGRADPAYLTPSEFADAERFWLERRGADARMRSRLRCGLLGGTVRRAGSGLARGVGRGRA
jgi:hypothetical protein